MGGYGSGRTSYRQKVENCRLLDIYKMKRLGCLDDGRAGHWVWSRNGEEVARIGYRCDAEMLHLSYRVRIHGGDWEDIRQHVQFAHVACNYGGHRTYVLCPGIVAGRHCDRRVGKLYSAGRYFLCRHCYGLAYECQSEAPHYRMLRRANKLRDQLDGFDFFVQRPKGMWERTFLRKRAEIDYLDELAERMFIGQLEMSAGQKKLIRGLAFAKDCRPEA